MKLRINESGESNAKRLFNNPDYMQKIKTFAILTAENRDATPVQRKVNKELNRELKKNLSSQGIEKNIISSRYPYYKVKGKYLGTVEHSFIIYNITLDDAKHLSEVCGQQAFIFVLNNNGLLKFQMWANASRSGYSYKMVDEKEEFDICDVDAQDNYTQISRDFKFSIPFTAFGVDAADMIESIYAYCDEMGHSKESVDAFIEESMNTSVIAKKRYFSRGTIIPPRGFNKCLDYICN